MQSIQVQIVYQPSHILLLPSSYVCMFVAFSSRSQCDIASGWYIFILLYSQNGVLIQFCIQCTCCVNVDNCFDTALSRFMSLERIFSTSSILCVYENGILIIHGMNAMNCAVKLCQGHVVCYAYGHDMYMFAPI